MKKNKEKEKNTNPYHKEYGVFSNSIHALKSMLNYGTRGTLTKPTEMSCLDARDYSEK